MNKQLSYINLSIIPWFTNFVENINFAAKFLIANFMIGFNKSG